MGGVAGTVDPHSCWDPFPATAQPHGPALGPSGVLHQRVGAGVWWGPSCACCLWSWERPVIPSTHGEQGLQPPETGSWSTSVESGLAESTKAGDLPRAMKSPVSPRGTVAVHQNTGKSAQRHSNGLGAAPMPSVVGASPCGGGTNPARVLLSHCSDGGVRRLRICKVCALPVTCFKRGVVWGESFVP